MRGIIFQDIFSNLFLGMLVLLVLAVRLSGELRTDPTPPLQCKIPSNSLQPDLAVAYHLSSSVSPAGKAKRAWKFSDIVNSPATVTNVSMIAIYQAGCVTHCYRCTTPPWTLSAQNNQFKVSGCRTVRCEAER